jgi:regulator of protease activity HflC (stomatin/prohibitin superfamily)
MQTWAKVERSENCSVTSSRLSSSASASNWIDANNNRVECGVTCERAKVSQDIVQKLQAKLTKYRIIVSDINVQNFHFDPQFAEAVRQKVVAGQNRLTAEQQLETARVTAQQRIVEAEGQAKAIAIQAQAIQQQGGHEYVALEAVKKWDGRLPAQWSGAAIPFVNFAEQK